MGMWHAGKSQDLRVGCMLMKNGNISSVEQEGQTDGKSTCVSQKENATDLGCMTAPPIGRKEKS